MLWSAGLLWRRVGVILKMAKTNPYESLGRERKSRAILDFLRDLGRPDLLDPDVVALATEHEREQVATLAGVNKPSAETWAAVVFALRGRKRKVA